MIQEQQQINSSGDLHKRTRKSKRIAKQKSKNKQRLRKKKNSLLLNSKETTGNQSKVQKKKFQIKAIQEEQYLSEQQQRLLKEFFDQKIDKLFTQSISQELKNQLEKALGINQNFSSKRQLLFQNRIRLCDDIISGNKIIGYQNIIQVWNKFMVFENNLQKIFHSQVYTVKNKQTGKMYLIINHQMSTLSNGLLVLVQISQNQLEILKKKSTDKKCQSTNNTYSVEEQKQEGVLTELDQQIESLFDIYLQEQNFLIQEYNRILKNGNYKESSSSKLFSNESQSEVSQSDIFMTKIIFKIFNGAFDDKPIDRLNYHRDLETFELKKDIKNYPPLQKKQKLTEFLQKRKGKKGKAAKFQLHTNCQACFSPLSEQYNNFHTCKQCHYRVHKLCARFNEKCDRCTYKRLTQKKKQQIRQCFICGVRDLMIHRISSNKYVHIFCMLAHNLWKIDYQGATENKVIKFHCNSQKLKKKIEQGQDQCFLCLKNSPVKKTSTYFLLKCQNCNKKFHAMCGYLKGGFKFTIDIQSCQNRRINLRVDCCSSSKEEKLRIASDRRYKINFQKIVFRSNGIGKQKNTSALGSRQNENENDLFEEPNREQNQNIQQKQNQY